MWAYGDNSCGCLINGLSHSNWIMSLGIQRAWSCPGYRTVWNTLTHTHTHIMQYFHQEAFYKSTVCMITAESLEDAMEITARCFSKVERKKFNLLRLGLCCVVAVWERWHRWEVVIPLSSSSTLMQLCLLFIFAQKIFGFLQILRRVFPIFFFQPLPELQKWSTHIWDDEKII